MSRTLAISASKVVPSPGFPVMSGSQQGQRRREIILSAITESGVSRRAISKALREHKLRPVDEDTLAEILSEPHVSAELDRRLQQISALRQVTKERVLIELAHTAFVDVSKLFDVEDVDTGDGRVVKAQRLKNLGDLDESTARAVHGFKITKDGFVVPVVGDKLAALSILARATGAIPTGKKVQHAHVHVGAGAFGSLPTPAVTTDDFDDEDLDDEDDVVDGDVEEDDSTGEEYDD